jgi:hypothetical protein
MSLLPYYIKGIVSNQRLWIAGVGQMVGWLFLVAYVFGAKSSGTESALLSGISVWYGYITLASFAVLAMTIVATISYASYSLAYSFRYTKLSPLSYILNLLGSSSVVGIILSAIMLVITFGLFSERFGMSLPPSNVGVAIGVSALAGVFEFALGAAIVLIVVNYLGMQSQGFTNFLPVMLSVFLGLSQAFAALPKLLIYLSPFNEIESLLYFGYSGMTPHVLLSDPTTAVLDWQYLVLGLAAWITILVSVDGFLLKRLKPRQIEEARQI